MCVKLIKYGGIIKNLQGIRESDDPQMCLRGRQGVYCVISQRIIKWGYKVMHLCSQ
jgi:hypothetical protein